MNKKTIWKSDIVSQGFFLCFLFQQSWLFHHFWLFFFTLSTFHAFFNIRAFDFFDISELFEHYSISFWHFQHFSTSLTYFTTFRLLQHFWLFIFFTSFQLLHDCVTFSTFFPFLKFSTCFDFFPIFKIFTKNFLKCLN